MVRPREEKLHKSPVELETSKLPPSDGTTRQKIGEDTGELKATINPQDLTDVYKTHSIKRKQSVFFS